MSLDTLHKVKVSAEDSGCRLDKWLSHLSFISSRSRAAELIELGLVTSNGKSMKASTKLRPDMEIVIRIPPPEATELKPLARNLDILYEDDDLVVVNKPAGLVVHPAAGHAQDTLVNILLHHIGKLALGFAENRPGIVHRLDRDTSGVLVVAKNDLAHHKLAEQFRHKIAHRIYWAIVHGLPQKKSGTITTHLARHPQDRKRFASHPTGHGKRAVTHYQVLESVPSRLSWISCRLETGRTHQIRVHLSESGHPIVGDILYGRKSKTREDQELGRLALHACELGFQHPRHQEFMFFKAPWPDELKKFARAKGFHVV